MCGCIAGALCCAQSRAEDFVIDFDDYAAGTVITNQYPGVTFSAPPNSCGGAPGIQPILAAPAGGTSSGSLALTVQNGCPDFNPDYLRMVFEVAHADITFTLGNSPGTYQVRVYTTTAGGAPVATQSIVISGTGYVGVHRLVKVSRPARDIRRIEVEDPIQDAEYIDDLTLDCPDLTPPTAEISSPAALGCVCSGVAIYGTANDPDGELANWRLERKAPDAATWTLINTSSTPVSGLVSHWYPASSATQGYYLLRLTVTNACGAISSAETVVFLDRQLDSGLVRWPDNGAVVGGVVTVDGTAWDHCAGTLAVEYRPAGGSWNPVTAVALPWVITDPLGHWNTVGTVVDGNYELRVTAVDGCDTDYVGLRSVAVDNTPPLAVLTSPTPCSYQDGSILISGTAMDTHMAEWELHYTHHGTGWLPLASGTGSVNGQLLIWDVSDLPHCAHTLRLRVTDTAILDSDATKHNVSEALVSFNIGALGDMNCDGRTDNFDIDPFVNCLINGACYCP